MKRSPRASQPSPGGSLLTGRDGREFSRDTLGREVSHGQERTAAPERASRGAPDGWDDFLADSLSIF